MLRDEITLAKRISQGDQEAFTCLFNRYKKEIYCHIWAMIRDRFEAEDLTQEVFFRAYRAMATYSGNASLGKWLRKIATNICIDKLRKKSVPVVTWPVVVSKEGNEKVVEFPDSSRPPLDAVQSYNERDIIHKAIACLPPYYREVVILHDIMEYSGNEIAKKISRPLGTVKSRLSRAHNMLARLLSKEYGNLSREQTNIFEREMVAS